MRYLLLEVTGTREYRGHKVGDRFVTNLDPALRRGIDRGNVRVLAEIDPGLKVGDYGLPEDWPLLAADDQVTERGGTK